MVRHRERTGGLPASLDDLPASARPAPPAGDRYVVVPVPRTGAVGIALASTVEEAKAAGEVPDPLIEVR